MDAKQAEAEYLASTREARVAAERMDERLKALPVKVRLAVYKAAHEGGDLVALVEAAEKGQLTSQRVFEPGQVVLADVDDVRHSVRIVEVWKPSDWFAGTRLYVQLLGYEDRAVVMVEDVVPPCAGYASCRDDQLRCTHCGEDIADPHAPGCPHLELEADDEPDDECDAHPAEPEEQDEEEPAEPRVTVSISSWSGGTTRVGGTREELEAYAGSHVAWRYRESTVAALLAWLANGAPSPHRVVAWHGETETWSVDATA